MFSVCTCSWNTLEYLKILYRGLKRNTRLPWELIVHDNGSTDGTLEWLQENKIKHARSETNEGVAAVNKAAAQAKYKWIVNINTDHYPLPGWDIKIYQQALSFETSGIRKYTISCMNIEPFGDNPEFIIKYFGHDENTFIEDELIKFAMKQSQTGFILHTTQYSHPITMPKSLWDEFGGVDTRYYPGYASDHDIAAEAYRVGCRHFKMLADAYMYHFVSKTGQQLPQELKRIHGHDTFEEKWGMSVEEFRKRLGVAETFKQAEEGIL